ncbi:unnamed protein product [Prorocentrum cordatum]|uniref:Uncharacterized protein n=1 Tax=Prorocentrum cordatum TaxID=2364126 RepID=A0ABN9SWV6_9DINO|nr:unnamed protein product [Polarella glacialis]
MLKERLVDHPIGVLVGTVEVVIQVPGNVQSSMHTAREAATGLSKIPSYAASRVERSVGGVTSAALAAGQAAEFTAAAVSRTLDAAGKAGVPGLVSETARSVFIDVFMIGRDPAREEQITGRSAGAASELVFALARAVAEALNQSGAAQSAEEHGNEA